MEFEKIIQETLLSFSLNVAYYRKKQKLSQEQLSEKARISTNLLSKIEATGIDSNPTLTTAISLAIALGVPVEKLLEVRD